MFEFSIYIEFFKMRDSKLNDFLKWVMLIGIEISLSKLMLAEVTVVRNPTTLKKEMPKGFVQSNIIIVAIFTLFF